MNTQRKSGWHSTYKIIDGAGAAILKGGTVRKHKVFKNTFNKPDLFSLCLRQAMPG
jgi:hypothetical protein